MMETGTSKIMTDNYTVIATRPVIMYTHPRSITERRIDADYYRPEFVDNQTQLENSDLEIHELKDLWLEGRYGTLPDSADYLDEGVFLIRGGDFRDLDVVDDANLIRVPMAYWENGLKARAYPGEVLMLAKGATIDGPNSVALCSTRFEKALVNGSVFRIKPKPGVDAAYLTAYMATSTFLLQKRRAISNTGIFYNDLESIETFLVPLPPRPVQTYIGDKVRLAERCRSRARELWKTSEQVLSQALNLSLNTQDFELFNPLELQSEHYRLIATEPVSAWIHPDIMEHELGAQYYHPRRANVVVKLRASGIPLKRLLEIAMRCNERVSGAQIFQSPYYVGLGEIDSTIGSFNLVSPQQAEITGTATLFKSGDILFSKLRPYLNKVSICPAHVKRACGSTELLVYRAHKEILPYYVFFVLKSNVGLYQVIDVTAGSTLPRVDPEIIDEILVPLIDEECQKNISDNVQQVFALLSQAATFVAEAKADVEALIEGRLDVAGIVAGRVIAPTWEALSG